MVDETRSNIMRAVKGKNTSLELIIRKQLHKQGYRFRLHRSDLPGKPDIVFPARRKVLFVNGCFWHGHNCARGARIPKTNQEYWTAKIQRNKARDAENIKRLNELGWSSLTVWECEMKNQGSLQKRMTDFLNY